VKEVQKLLYVRDFGQPISSEIERLLDLRSFGLKEIIFLHTTKGEEWAGRLADQGLKSKDLLVDEPLVPAILNASQREGVSLIAANLNRQKRRLLHGSLTTELLRASTLPVLIFPENAEASVSSERGIFAHLIFVTDWSPVSEKALGYLLALNLKTITKTLDIVHVIDKKLSVRDIRSLQDRLKESRRIFVDHGIDAESHVYAGKPPEEIMLAAEDYDATCIVMGTTGKSAAKDLWSGSYSYRVAEASVVPTLFVP
jgi:nucleotide-binding universal stress UspA family protein